MNIHAGKIPLTRLILCALLLLCTWISWLCAVQVSNYTTISLRYNIPISQSKAEQACRYAVKTKSPFFPTYWSQSSVKCVNTFTYAQSTLLTVWGDVRLVLRAPILLGSYPAIAQKDVCAVSDSLAWQLWGSEDILGLTAEIDGKSYTVCGIFDEQSPVAIVGTDTAEWQAVELSTTLKDSRKTEALSFAALSGLGTADSYIDNSVVAWFSCFAAILPLLILVIVRLVHYIRKGLRRLGRWHGTAVFVILLAIVLLLPMILETLPAGIVPTRWSDFDFWGRLFQSTAEAVKDYLMRHPLFIDGKIQMWLLSQMGITLVQTGLLTAVLMLFYSKNKRL